MPTTYDRFLTIEQSLRRKISTKKSTGFMSYLRKSDKFLQPKSLLLESSALINCSRAYTRRECNFDAFSSIMVQKIVFMAYLFQTLSRKLGDDEDIVNIGIFCCREAGGCKYIISSVNGSISIDASSLILFTLPRELVADRIPKPLIHLSVGVNSKYLDNLVQA